MGFELTIFLIIYGIGALNAYMSGRDDLLELQMATLTNNGVLPADMFLRKRVVDTLYSSWWRLALSTLAWPLIIFVWLLLLAQILWQRKHG